MISIARPSSSYLSMELGVHLMTVDRTSHGLITSCQKTDKYAQLCLFLIGLMVNCGDSSGMTMRKECSLGLGKE